MTYRNPIMLPTSNPHQGRWVWHKLHSINPASDQWNGDELAYRFALVSDGYRELPRLKQRIKRSLGYKALRG